MTEIYIWNSKEFNFGLVVYYASLTLWSVSIFVLSILALKLVGTS
ncbi:MAG: hypothetical protein U5N85_16620 [Arcicella sp.]|nr:hypothetical protein [Arcicella sp.]